MANHAMLAAMRALPCAIGVAVFLAAPAAAEPPTRWQQVSPVPTAADLHDVCHGAGLYLAVGRDGSVVQSRDGDHWSRQALGEVPLRGVAFGNGRFVAVGDRSWREGAAIYTSPDARRWSRQLAKLDLPLRAVTYAAAQRLFVAVGGAGALLTSLDGASWTRREAGTTASLTAVLAAAGAIVIVGDEGTVLVSRDGTRWRRRPSGMRARLEEVIHDGVRFLAVGSRVILSSADGEAWRPRPVALALRGLARSPGVTVSSERGAILRSTDSVDWVPVPIPGLGFVNRIRYLNAQFLAVGDDGMILSSLDGGTWTQRSSGTAAGLAGVVWTGKRFVGVGEQGAVVISADGKRWRRGPLLRGGLRGVGLGRIGAGARSPRLVAVGERGRIYSSADEGETWQARECGVSATLLGISHALHRWIAVGEGGALCVSGDGAGWARRNLSHPCDLVGVAGDAKQAIAICSDGRSYLSLDALRWQPAGRIVRGQSCGSPLRLRSLALAEDRYLAVGGEGAIFASGDGRSWQDRSLEIPGCPRRPGSERRVEPRAPPSLAAVIPVEGKRFIAVGEVIAWVATDGPPRLETPPVGGLTAAAAGKPGVVVVGDHGRILLLPENAPPR